MTALTGDTAAYHLTGVVSRPNDPNFIRNNFPFFG
jgi:hypothetical protein